MKAGSFDALICQDLSQTLQKEWVETNGLGGIASSTVAGVNTRRAHGLLALPIQMQGSYLLFSNLDETLYIDDAAYALSTFVYGDTVYPDGYRHLAEFSFFPFPSWIFKIGDIVLLKTFRCIQGEETILIRYQILGGDTHLLRLEMKPLLAFRSQESLCRKEPGMQTALELKPGFVRFSADQEGLPPLFFYHNAAIMDRTGVWQTGFTYRKEQEMGFDFTEDLFSPFRLNYTFIKDREIYLYATGRQKESIDIDFVASYEENRRRDLKKKFRGTDPKWERLFFSGKSFFMDRNPLMGSVRREPWFESSVRESLLAFRGLLLESGQLDRAAQTLFEFSNQMKGGILSEQNGTGTSASPLDLPLWFIQVCYDYFKVSRDNQTMALKLFPAMESVIDSWTKQNSDFKVLPNGLVSFMSDRTPGSWMNVKIGAVPLTPRNGEPVEIQALWYNALCIMVSVAEDLNLSDRRIFYQALAEKVKKSFRQFFWVNREGMYYLADRIVDGEPDCSVRPNQLFALGLPFPVLEYDFNKWNSILQMTKKYLLTPYGLRTLAPHERDFKPHVEGDAVRRRRAWHQGAAWTWLLIPFVIAYLRVHGNSKKVKNELFSYFEPLWKCLDDDVLGYIPEFFDGHFPHKSAGNSISPSALSASLELYRLLTREDASWEQLYRLNLR